MAGIHRQPRGVPRCDPPRSGRSPAQQALSGGIAVSRSTTYRPKRGTWTPWQDQKLVVPRSPRRRCSPTRSSPGCHCHVSARRHACMASPPRGCLKTWRTRCQPMEELPVAAAFLGPAASRSEKLHHVAWPTGKSPVAAVLFGRVAHRTTYVLDAYIADQAIGRRHAMPMCM